MYVYLGHLLLYVLDAGKGFKQNVCDKWNSTRVGDPRQVLSLLALLVQTLQILTPEELRGSMPKLKHKFSVLQDPPRYEALSY